MKTEKSEVIGVPTERGVVRLKVTPAQANYWKILEGLCSSLEQFKDIRQLVNALTGGNPKIQTSKVYIFIRELRKLGYAPVARWPGWTLISPGRDTSLRYGRKKETLLLLALRILEIPKWWEKSEPQIAEILQQKGAIHAALVFIGKTMPEHRREYELWKNGAKERTGRKGKHLATVQEIAKKILLVPKWWEKSENEMIKILKEENRATYVHEAFYYIGTLPEQQENFEKWRQGIWARRRKRLGRQEANIIRIAERVARVPQWENIPPKALGEMLRENYAYVSKAKKLLRERRNESRGFSERVKVREKFSYALHGAAQGTESAQRARTARIKREACIETILAMPNWETKTMRELVDLTGVSKPIVKLSLKEIVWRHPEQRPRYEKWEENRGKRRGSESVLTQESKIFLHIYKFQTRGDEYNKPFELTEEGIGTAIGINKSHASRFLTKLGREGSIQWKKAHVRKALKRRKCFFLTPSGVEKVKELLEGQQAEEREEEVAMKPDVPIKKELPTDGLYPDDRKILAFLHEITKGKTFDEFYPYELTGQGIVDGLGISRDAVKRSLEDLEKKELVTKFEKKVKGIFFKRDVFILTEKGLVEAKKVAENP